MFLGGFSLPPPLAWRGRERDAMERRTVGWKDCASLLSSARVRRRDMMTFFICDAMIAIVSGGVGGTVFSSQWG